MSKRNKEMQEELAKVGLKAISIWRWCWFRKGTGELNWYARGIILVLAVAPAVAIFYCSAKPIEWLLPSSIASDTEHKFGTLARVLVPTLYSLPTFLGLWLIRTHDKEIEFRNHQKQLSRNQIDKAVDLLAGEDPIARGLGVSRLTHLHRDEKIAEEEYLGYMAMCQSWGTSLLGEESEEQKKPTMVACGTYLKEAYLVQAYLKGARLEGARLERVRLDGAQLEGAHLEGAVLVGAYLNSAHLEGAHLHGARLGGADFTGANLARARLEVVNLQGVNLETADFTGAFLGRANLTGAKLSGANLSEADLRGANLTGCDLMGANLAGTHLIGIKLSRANLAGARIRADLEAVNLEMANLTGAYLEEVNLRGANLIGANLEGAKLSRAVVDGCKMTAATRDLFSQQGVNVERVILVESASGKSA